MTSHEILSKAIDKAIVNGWDLPPFIKDEFIELHDIKTIIFSHDFAKAFWGYSNICTECKNICDTERDEGGEYSKCHAEFVIEAWQYHLQQMVLETEPLRYLEKFI